VQRGVAEDFSAKRIYGLETSIINRQFYYFSAVYFKKPRVKNGVCYLLLSFCRL
jgi:hypothetical protein